MSLIPWPYRCLALVLLAAALIGFGWIKGAGHVQAQWDAAVQQQALQAAEYINSGFCDRRFCSRVLGGCP